MITAGSGADPIERGSVLWRANVSKVRSGRAAPNPDFGHLIIVPNEQRRAFKNNRKDRRVRIIISTENVRRLPVRGTTPSISYRLYEDVFASYSADVLLFRKR